MTKTDQQRIAQAILERGNGATVSNGFAPFTDLLREFAKQQKIATFAEACQQMFLSSRPNQWSIREHAPKILLSSYLPEVLEGHHLRWYVSSPKVDSWNEQIVGVLDSPTGLQSGLDDIVADIKQSAPPLC
jgi:hypothetical protein